MDRQPLTDRLGDRLLAEYGGAAAAYSLRALNGNGDNVVRVRRASDNDEKDFTALQISSGEMVNWVNSQTVPPLDIGVETSDGRIPVPEGGTSIGTPAAAYSLRNLSTTYTGNVVDVRRNSDDAEESFTAEEVSDGTLEAWVTAPVSSLIGNRMYFDGVDDCSVFTSSVVLTEDFSITFSVLISEVSGFGANSSAFFGESTISKFGITSGTTAVLTNDSSSGFTLTLTETIDLNSIYNLELRRSSGNLMLYKDGVLISNSVAAAGNFTIDAIGRGRARFFNGLIYDVTINGVASYQGYGNTNADWEDQIGSNDGTVNGSPELFTGQGFDGTVSKWYDQSGNDNHAVQTTPANQPTIVEGGSLLDELKFDGVDDFMQSDVATSGDDTTILVAKNNSTTGDSTFLDNQSDPAKVLFVTNSLFRVFYGSATDLTYGNLNNDYNLHFISTNATDSNNRYGSLNGIVDLLDAGTNNYTALNIGITRVNTFPLNGSIKELIIYDSDQSDNRTAIEANIGETYGITGIPAYDNTVDGFVETWYDQSGSGNHATQSVTGNQPKIVDGGSLVAGGLDFDNVDDFLESVNTETFGTSARSIFAVCAPNSITANADAIVQLSKSTTTGEAWTLTPEVATRTNIRTWISSSPATLSQSNLISNIYTGGNLHAGNSMWLNGNSVARTSGTDGSINTATSEILIGANVAGTLEFDGAISEIIIYKSDQSATRTAIEGNINDHYNIYP